jgi:hypothetical protein
MKSTKNNTLTSGIPSKAHFPRLETEVDEQCNKVVPITLFSSRHTKEAPLVIVQGVCRSRKISINLTDRQYHHYQAQALVQNTSLEAEIEDYLSKRFPLNAKNQGSIY